MKVIKAIWAVIAFLWLGGIAVNVALSISQAQSAMQASQLYNDATANILGIIAITLLLKLGDGSDNRAVLRQIKQHLEDMAESTDHIRDSLNRLEQRIGNVGDTSNPQPAQLRKTEENAAAISPSSQTPTAAPTITLCPRCGVPMVVQTVAQGEHKGKQYYRCPNFPRCREMLPLR
jgi:hypothetical protein